MLLDFWTEAFGSDCPEIFTRLTHSDAPSEKNVVQSMGESSIGNMDVEDLEVEMFLIDRALDQPMRSTENLGFQIFVS